MFQLFEITIWESWNAQQKERTVKCAIFLVGFLYLDRIKRDTVKNTRKKPEKADHGSFGQF